MARQELPSTGIFHVTSRSAGRTKAFRDGKDRDRWLAQLRSTTRRFGWRLHAWCVLGTHYHVVVETRLTALSRGMHRLNGLSAQEFNRRWSRWGHVFGDRFARRMARRYRRRGLTPAARAIVSFLSDRGLDGAAVLEIGGGVGELHVELLRRGAARATNLEISASYEPEAGALLERAGLRQRVDRRILDIAQSPEQVEAADVVVLHRVVCCYPDYQRLLAAAGGKADRLLVFSHPPENLVTRAAIGWENACRRLKGDSFRAFVHPPAAMLAVLSDAGLRPTYRWRGLGWCVAGLER